MKRWPCRQFGASWQSSACCRRQTRGRLLAWCRPSGRYAGASAASGQRSIELASPNHQKSERACDPEPRSRRPSALLARTREQGFRPGFQPRDAPTGAYANSGRCATSWPSWPYSEHKGHPWAAPTGAWPGSGCRQRMRSDHISTMALDAIPCSRCSFFHVAKSTASDSKGDTRDPSRPWHNAS